MVYMPFTSMLALTQHLRDSNIITHKRIFDTIAHTNRADFCENLPYFDSPQPIGYGQTISAPHMHAYALEYLFPALKRGARVLDVGSGSGYLTVCLAKLVSGLEEQDIVQNASDVPSDAGQVIGVEIESDLLRDSITNVRKHHSGLLDSHAIKLEQSSSVDDAQGFEMFGTFDAIHVGAAAAGQVPQSLLKALNNGGIMVIPVDHRFLLVKKDANGNVSEEELLLVSYVPLV